MSNKLTAEQEMYLRKIAMDAIKENSAEKYKRQAMNDVIATIHNEQADQVDFLLTQYPFATTWTCNPRVLLRIDQTGDLCKVTITKVSYLLKRADAPAIDKWNSEKHKPILQAQQELAQAIDKWNSEKHKPILQAQQELAQAMQPRKFQDLSEEEKEVVRAHRKQLVDNKQEELNKLIEENYDHYGITARICIGHIYRQHSNHKVVVVHQNH